MTAAEWEGVRCSLQKEIPEEGPASRPQVYIETVVSESVSVIRLTVHNMYLKCVIFTLVAGLALSSGRSTTSSQANAIPQESARSDDSFFGDLRFLHKMYQDCASSDVSTCLKLKLVTAMDRAARAYPVVQVMEGVSFVQDAADQTPQAQSENEIEANLPRALNDREDALNTLIVDRIFKFFQTHTLQVS